MKNKIIELPPQCFVCKDFKYTKREDGLYCCSANCFRTNDIFINNGLREYFEDPSHQVFEDDTSVYSLDVTDKTLKVMERLAISEDEIMMVEMIKSEGYDYINVEPCSYFIME